MFRYRFSRMERWWLLGLRLAWQYRASGLDATRLIDRLMQQAGLGACAKKLQRLLAALEDHGANHLYFERFDQPGVTGDERDLIRALKLCYLDDPLAAESALGALLPPGRTAEVIELLQAVAKPDDGPLIAKSALSIESQFSTAACH